MYEYRKKHIRKICSAALIAFLCMVLIMTVRSFPVFGADTVTAVIPVFVETGVTQESYTFRLTALDNAPMPECDTIVISGTGSGRFVIEYSSVGVYRYTVTQEIPETGSGTYDTTVYNVIVTIQQTESGIGSTVIAHREGEEAGKSEIIYDNTPGSIPKETEDTDSTENPEETEDPEGTENPGETEYPEETEESETTENPNETEKPTGAENPGGTEDPGETESSEETESTKTTDADNPKTGDDAPIGFWIIMLAGICAVVGSFLHRRMKPGHRSKGN